MILFLFSFFIQFDQIGFHLNTNFCFLIFYLLIKVFQIGTQHVTSYNTFLSSPHTSPSGWCYFQCFVLSFVKFLFSLSSHLFFLFFFPFFLFRIFLSLSSSSFVLFSFLFFSFIFISYLIHSFQSSLFSLFNSIKFYLLQFYSIDDLSFSRVMIGKAVARNLTSDEKVRTYVHGSRVYVHTCSDCYALI